MLGVSFISIIVGGFIRPRVFNVETRFRRASHLWFLAGCHVASTVCQASFGLVPSVIEAGVLTLFIGAFFLSFAVLGAGIYYGSAARSNDISGKTRLAWIGLVPLLGLWLVFKRGRSRQNQARRTGLQKFVRDPLLVAGALATATVSWIASSAIDEKYLKDVWTNPELEALIWDAMTEAQKFAIQADLSAEDLPLRTDEMTVLSSIVADGTTLTINFDMGEGFGEFHAGLETDNVEEVCAPDMYAEEISDGGRVIYTFHRQDGQVLDAVTVAQAECERL